MEQTTYKQYQLLVRKAAWGKFSEKHGVPDLIISLLISVLVGFLWWLFKKGNDAVLVALATLGIFFLVYSVIYLGYFAREHVLIYNKQKEDMEKLNNELHPNEVKLTVLPIPDNSLPVGKVDLYIGNPTKDEIVDCQVILTNLSWKSEFGYSPENVSHTNRLFDKGEYFIGQKNDTIRANGSVITQIAENQNNNLVFLLKEPFLVDGLHYVGALGIEKTEHRLEITVVGRLKNSQIPARGVAQLLTFFQRGQMNFQVVKMRGEERLTSIQTSPVIYMWLDDGEQEKRTEKQN